MSADPRVAARPAAHRPHPAHAATAGGSRYRHVDAMRALAVMLVVVGHAGLGGIVPGGSGVTIFFGISGFLITYLLLRERDRTGTFGIGKFYSRRLLKIGPPLVAIIVVPTLVYAIWNEVDWSAFSAQAFFYYNWFKADGQMAGVLPGSGVVWSLSIEEQFYVVVAVVWFLVAGMRTALKWLTVLAVTMILVSTAARVVIATSASVAEADRIYYGSDTRFDAIGWGVLTAVVYFSWGHGRLPSLQLLFGRTWIPLTALAAYLASLVIRDPWFRDTFRFSIQSIATCAVILYGFAATQTTFKHVFDSVVGVRLVQVVGLASYSIYLVHYGMDELVDLGVGGWTGAGVASAAVILVKVLVSVLAGVVLYYLIEKPFEKVRARLR